MKDYDYSEMAQTYDQLEYNKEIHDFNPILDKILKEYDVKRVHDATCGTGLQVGFLHEQRYTVTASDLNEEMLAIAKSKFPKVSFEKQDLRSLYLKECDAIITIFNAVAHMTPADFQMAMSRIYNCLKSGGIYVFDIFNAQFMKQNFIEYEFIDRAVEFEGKKFVRFNHNSYDSNHNLMHVNQRTYVQEGLGKPEIKEEIWDMQIYSVQQLQKMLEKAGFSVAATLNLRGEQLDEQNDLNILMVAKK